MALTFRRPPEEDLERCRHCRFYTKTPTMCAPPGWLRCKLWNIDRAPTSRCRLWENRYMLRQTDAPEIP